MEWPYLSPHRIERTGDDTPATSIYRYVWRMSGHHQIWVALLAVAVAGLSMVPLELQRRIVNSAIQADDVELLISLGGVYLAVTLIQSGIKYVLRIYQGWISESAVRYSREHLSSLHARRRTVSGRDDDGRAVSVIGSEIETVGGFVGAAVSEPVVHVGMLVVQPLLAAASLLVFVPQLVVVPILQAMVNRLTKKRIDLLRDLSDRIADDGEVPEDDGDDGRSPLIDGIYGNRMKIYVLKFASKTAVNVLNALAPICALVLGGYIVIQGETTLGVVVAFISGFERLSNPTRQLIAFYRQLELTRVKHAMIARWM